MAIIIQYATVIIINTSIIATTGHSLDRKPVSTREIIWLGGVSKGIRETLLH